MSADLFSILNVIALGSLAGSVIGLAIGYLAKEQKSDWQSMSRNEKAINSALVLIFSIICIGTLAWYFLV